MTVLNLSPDPAKLDLIIRQGKSATATFSLAKAGVAWPSGTVTAKAQIRDQAHDVLIAEFTCTVTSTAAAHSIVIDLLPAVTAALTPGKGKWELEITRPADGYTVSAAYGDVSIIPEATK